MSTERSFNWRVLDEIERAIDASGKTRAQIIQLSGMRRNTFFVKMRGETPLTTEDISKLAIAVDMDPIFLLRNALAVTPSTDDEFVEESFNVEPETKKDSLGLAAKRRKPKQQ